MRKNIITFLILSVFLFFSFNIYAQTVPQEATPGVEEKTLKEKPIEEKVAPKKKAIVERISPEELELPPEAYEKFFIEQINIKGVTVLSPSALEKCANDFFNKMSAQEGLSIKAEKITQFFKETKEAAAEGKSLPKKIEPEEKAVIIKKPTKEAGLQEAAKILSNLYAKKLGDAAYDKTLDLEKEIISQNIISIKREMSLKDLIDLADAISELYSQQGYVTSQAYIPPQKIENNIVIINVLEGKVGRVLAKGQEHFKKELIERGIKERSGEVLRYSNLIKDLNYLNKNPDREVKAVLYPSKQPEYSDILLKVEDSRPFHIALEHDNLGSKYTGSHRNSVVLTHNNFSKNDDRMQLKYTISDTGGFKGFLGTYEFPLDNFGKKVGLDFSYARTTMGKEYEPLDVEGDAYVASLYYMGRLFEVNNIDGKYLLAFDVKRAVTDMLSINLYYDALRVFKTGLITDEYDAYGRTNLRTEIDSGFSSFLGASQKDNSKASRSGAGGQFVKYTLGVSRLNKFTPNTFILFNADGQFTSSILTSMEQIRSGGAYSVRGYPESEALGDYGFNSNLELRMPAYFWPKDLFPERFNPVDCLQFLTFIDAGYVGLKKVAVGQDKNRQLTGIGFGARLNLDEEITARADIAWPIGDEPEDDSHFKAHFGVNVSIDKTAEQQVKRLLEK